METIYINGPDMTPFSHLVPFSLSISPNYQSAPLKEKPVLIITC